MALQLTINTTASPVGWEAKGSRTWYRELDAMERLLYFFKHINPNLTQWTISICLKLPSSFQYSVEEIKAAWISLRLENPVIACTIENEGTGMQYQVLTKDELAEWAEETVHIDRSGRTSREMVVSTVRPKSSTLYFFPGPVREVAFHVRHELCDGVGLLIFANKFFQHLRKNRELGAHRNYSTDTIGDEIGRLPPPTISGMSSADLLSISPEMIETANRVVESYCDRTALSLKTRSGGIEKAIPSLPQGYVDHQFSKEESTAILNACRVNGITLAAAIWAAQAKTALQQSGKAAGHLTNFVPINLRAQDPSLISLENTIILAFTHLPVSKNSDFIDWAKHTQQTLARWRHDKDSIDIFKQVCKAMEEKVDAGVAYPAQFFLSNIGISDNYIEEPVEDVWINAMVSTASSGVFIVLTTHGKVRFTACYNRAFFDEGQIESYMEMVVGHLKKGLGLEGNSRKKILTSEYRVWPHPVCKL
ncbi:hypothetical protein TWF506_004780 [Arthrobotrys conoides]|uniref:Uncharacterized protein n=1 Tax=Arthrobotrys conoides TaxID=74498 RepID=A0AAN8N293_9PEZI